MSAPLITNFFRCKQNNPKKKVNFKKLKEHKYTKYTLNENTHNYNFFLPQIIDYEEYYTSRDPALLASNFTTNLAFLTNNWRHMLGRPTITLMATHYLMGNYLKILI